MSGYLTVHGVQGHAAYQHLADNPVRGILQLTQALMDPPFDAGTDAFPPTNLEVTSIDVGNTATNVIPARASAIFNIRFQRHLDRRQREGRNPSPAQQGAAQGALREGRPPVRFDITWSERPSHVFLTRNEPLIASLSAAVETVTAASRRCRRPAAHRMPVSSRITARVEFGLVGQTMHMVDERVALADLETLTEIYETFIRQWFAAHAAA